MKHIPPASKCPINHPRIQTANVAKPLKLIHFPAKSTANPLDDHPTMRCAQCKVNNIALKPDPNIDWLNVHNTCNICRVTRDMRVSGSSDSIVACNNQQHFPTV